MTTFNYQNLKNLVEMGIPGGIAGGVQLSSLYWLRTIIKYQYVYPQTLMATSRNLWKEQDRYRLYRGFIPNLSKVFLGKIGESSLIKHFQPENHNDIFQNTILTAGIITAWKTLMMPLDTIGNSYQVNGLNSKEIIKNRIKRQGVSTLWSGTLVYLNISFINYSIWVYTYHYLNKCLPTQINSDLRNGFIGLSSTFMADIVINPLRVLKTNIQSHPEKKKYSEIYRQVFKNRRDYFRGIQTKMIFNCLNGALYVILWKRLDEN